MANTVSLLSYANTFGDWVVVTNALAKENNDLASNNYVKPTGTLFLNSPTLGLQVSNNAIISGQLQVQGIGSSAFIQNNLQVGTQVYFSNTVLGLTNSGELISNGKISAAGSGLGLTVANNTTIGGSLTVGRFLTVSGNTQINNTVSILGATSISNTLSVTGDADFIANVAIDDYLAVTQGATVGSLMVGTSTTTDTLSVTNGASVGGQLAVGGNFVINGTTVYNTNTFTINAGSSVGLNSSFNVFRGTSGANASIRWSEANGWFDIRDVNNPSSFSRILTANLISTSLVSTNDNTVASSNAASILNNISTTAFARANTSSNTFVTNSGNATANTGIIRIIGANTITTNASSNVITISAPQNLAITSSPTFAGLTLTTALAVGQGGTGATSPASALNNLLPTTSGVPAGFVLATGGPGTFYWVAAPTGGGGGGYTPGTTIQSTRSFPTVNVGQTNFTTPTFTPGASQLRVYLNGVRQFNSAYTETSNTTISFVEGRSSGDVVMFEVDGYINNPYFANTIPFTAPFGGIVASANNIQLAIQDVETRKAALAGAAFTGTVTGITVDTNASNTAFATTAFVKNSLNSGNTFSHNITGNAAGNAGTVTNGVYTVGDQTIAGTKTFSSTIIGSISGNAGSVTNGVYTTGDQTIGGTKTFSSTISGSITGNAGSVTNGVYTNGSYANPSFITSLAASKSGLGAGDSVQHGSLGIGTGASGTTGEIRATNNITAYFSDERLKKKLGNIENALDKLMTLSGFYYEPNETAQALGYDVVREVGVSAQEVQKILPEIVVPAPIDDKYLTVRYEKMVPLLIEAIKELKAEIDELKGNNK